MKLTIWLLLLFLVREWQPAEADCRKKLCGNSKGITFNKCSNSKGNKGESGTDNTDCQDVKCDKEITFTNEKEEKSQWYHVPNAEYIVITEIDIDDKASVTITHLTDFDNNCKKLMLNSKANCSEKVIIKLKDLKSEKEKRKFKIKAIGKATIKFKCNKQRKCVKMDKNIRMRKMVNGKVTDPNEFPFMARLEAQYSETNNNFNTCNNKDTRTTDLKIIKKNCNKDERLIPASCGGSIINDQWILTAAHCVERIDRDGDFLVGVLVFLGDHLRSEVTKKEKPYWVTPAETEIFIHDDFKDDRNYDIALIKLHKTIDPDEGCRYPICLAPANMHMNKEGLVGCEVQAAGWGYKKDGKTSDELRKQQNDFFKIDQNKNCNNIPDKLFCYRHDTTETNIGDSGGPVFCDSANDYYYQVGIHEGGGDSTTTKDGKEIKERFQAAVKVTDFLDWINKKVDGNLP